MSTWTLCDDEGSGRGGSIGKVLICTHEDRPASLVGLKLLLLSLERHCPEIRVMVSCPEPDPRFEAWLRERQSVRLHVDTTLKGEGWNVKPRLLLHFLNAGYDEVVWIDADIVLARDFRPLLQGLSRYHLVVTEEQYWGLYQGGTTRTELWGLRPGRRLPSTINSGFVRATRTHRALLDAWQRLLAHPAYRRVQQRDTYERPIHMIGDQDVLTALIGSARFADVPLAYLTRGADIIQCVGPAGYTVQERLRNLRRGLPPLIHCAGPKPWTVSPKSSLLDDPKGYYDRVYLELNTYAWVARQYREALDEDIVGLDVRTRAARFFRALAFDHPTLQGLPLALFHTLARRAKRLLGITAWPTPRANVGPSDTPRGEQLLDAENTIEKPRARKAAASHAD
jgi:hypothetical protein